jgi:hypothetical protein
MSILIPPFVGAPAATPSGGVLAVDEVWLREPRLLVPGMQPLGPVELNKGHSLSKNLLVGVCKANELPRLAKQLALSYGAGTTFAQNGFIANADSAGVFTPSVSWEPYPFTMVFSAIAVAPAYTEFRYFVADTTYTNFSVYSAPDGSTFYVHGTSTSNNVSKLIDGKLHNFVVSMSAKNSGFYAIDGQLQSITSTGDGSSSAGVKGLGNRPSSSARFSALKYYLFCVFNESVSAGEVIDLSLNPFQLVVPA